MRIFPRRIATLKEKIVELRKNKYRIPIRKVQ